MPNKHNMRNNNKQPTPTLKRQILRKSTPKVIFKLTRGQSHSLNTRIGRQRRAAVRRAFRLWEETIDLIFASVIHEKPHAVGRIDSLGEIDSNVIDESIGRPFNAVAHEFGAGAGDGAGAVGGCEGL